VQKWIVEYYQTENGKQPVMEFIDSLNKKMQAKAIAEISLLQEFGNTLREPYSKHLQGGLFELRIKVASNISRIFYFFFVGKRIILTNGFIKKTVKPPPNEIKKALKYKQDYQERHT
jgi:phage-related protein